jgi:DNA segregation ATPase FtsK/SpoIIIE-like protein
MTRRPNDRDHESDNDAAARAGRTHRGNRQVVTAAAVTVDAPDAPESPRRYEMPGIAVATAAVLLFLALMSYQPATASSAATDLVGPIGVFVADVLYWLFGASSYFFIVLAGAGARSLFTGRPLFGRWEEATGYTLVLTMIAMLFELMAPSATWFGHQLGGWTGEALATMCAALIGRLGATVCGLALLLMAFVLITESSVVALATALIEKVRSFSQQVELRAQQHIDSEQGLVAAGPEIQFDSDELPLERREHEQGVRESWRQRAGRVTGFFRTRLGGHDRSDDLSSRKVDPAVDRHSTGQDDDTDDEFDLGLHDAPTTTSERLAGLLDRQWADGWAIGPEQDEAPPRQAGNRATEALTKSNRASEPVSRPVPTFSADDDDEDDHETSLPTTVFRRGAAPAVARSPATSHGSVMPSLGEWVNSPSDDSQSAAIAARTASQTSASVLPTGHAPVLPVATSPAALPAAAPVVSAPAAAGLRRETQLGSPARHDVDDADHDDEPDMDAGHDDLNESGGTMEVDVDDVISVRPRSTEYSGSGPVIFESEALVHRKKAEELDRVRIRHDAANSEWRFPPMNFLRYEENDGSHIDPERLKLLATRLEEVLGSFRIAGTVTGICPGPVVTRFEFEPETGTKLSKISGLSDDIAMALKALKVRIIAPIPGKGCVGIEVPNEIRESVYLKEILADERFTRSRSPLTVALGKDIEGFPVVADFAKMPHLLIAGTTGSGKSVTVNAMITSILYNASPDDVRMILIDPKQLEFAIYQDMPHLLLPVVTDPAKANTALQWAVVEMERRYKLMAAMKVRNLAGYNQKLTELEQNVIDSINDPRARDPLAWILEEADEDGQPAHRRMYYVLIIVDEFADLMMTAGKDVEIAVARLAQKARAAGIHIMLATQRPSVDVLTGVIKSNFPTRMSCRLMSGTDSRTVLDSIGAENLLGQGDMLYRPNGSQDLIRVHGAYVDEREIEQIVDFLKQQRAPQYDERILKPAAESGDDDDEPADELYDQAIQAVIDAGFASISMLQRNLRVGYNRSARMVERMERDGIIGPASGGSAKREVLVGQLFKG